MSPRALVMILKLAVERFPHLVILGLKCRLQKLIHEFALPILDECSQFLLHLLLLIALVLLTHSEDIVASSTTVCDRMLLLLLSDCLDLISAE